MKTKIIQFNIDFPGFWNRYAVLCILLILALIFDTLSTIHFMHVDGIEGELHPLVRGSALLFGPVVGPVLSAFVFKAIAGLLLALYLRRFAVWIVTVPAVTATIVGFINFLSCPPVL